MILRTARLRLREWQPEDLDPFAAMNRDPEVMRHFPTLQDRTGSAGFIERVQACFVARSFCAWALELPGSGFIGFCGLMVPRFTAPFTPCVEIGWRLARAHWGQGYATEAARTALADGFGRCALREIAAYTVPANLPSRRVMERIGMTHDPADDFDHPTLPEGHPLKPHVLYRITAPAASG